MKYIFQQNCTQNKMDDLAFTRIRLLSTDYGKEIKFCAPYYSGMIDIRRPEDNQARDKMEYSLPQAKPVYKNDVCVGYKPEKICSGSIPLEEAKAKVILDNYCEYQISLSIRSNEWVTLPRSSLVSKDLDLKKYYNRKLRLSAGKKYGRLRYILKVIYGNEETCEFTLGFPLCSGNRVIWECFKEKYREKLENATVVIENNYGSEPLIYFADEKGNSITNLTAEGVDLISHYNLSLKSMLLESSNIREVLPELEINDDVDMDKRQLKRFMHNIIPAQVTEELITKRATELVEGIAEKLRENPGKTKGSKGDVGFPGMPQMDCQELLDKKVSEVNQVFQV